MLIHSSNDIDHFLVRYIFNFSHIHLRCESSGEHVFAHEGVFPQEHRVLEGRALAVKAARQADVRHAGAATHAVHPTAARRTHLGDLRQRYGVVSDKNTQRIMKWGDGGSERWSNTP